MAGNYEKVILDTAMTHIYDWLDIPAKNGQEIDAKEWLSKFMMPSYTKYIEGIDKWLAKYQVTVEWKGKRYICTGASRLGDVWLKQKDSPNFYDHRVGVDELSNWKRIQLPKKNKNEL